MQGNISRYTVMRCNWSNVPHLQMTVASTTGGIVNYLPPGFSGPSDPAFKLVLMNSSDTLCVCECIHMCWCVYACVNVCFHVHMYGYVHVCMNISECEKSCQKLLNRKVGEDLHV